MTQPPQGAQREPVPVLVPVAPAPSVTWPAGVPTLEEALRMLRGALPVSEEGAQIVSRVRGSLSDLELVALNGGKLPFDAAPLRQALGMRLCLAVALERAPSQAGEADRDALNALLAQVDLVLEGLRQPQGLDEPEMLKRIEATRNALVRDAVALSEVSRPPAAGPQEPSAPRKPSASSGRVVLLSTADSEAQATTRRRNMVGIAVAVVVAAGGVAFHVWSARRAFIPPPSVPGAPPGIGVTRSPDGAMLVHTLDGKAPSAEVLEWVKGRELQGYQRQQLGPGLILLRPSPETPSMGAPSP